jgi:hypothetical protein
MNWILHCITKAPFKWGGQGGASGQDLKDDTIATRQGVKLGGQVERALQATTMAYAKPHLENTH